MNAHSRARTCPASRALLVQRIQVEHWPPARAAEAAGISVRTVFKWLARYRVEGLEGLKDRSSRPRRSPTRLPEEWRDPDVLLLGGVAAEIPPRSAQLFQAEVVGANAQGWLRAFDPDGTVYPLEWKDPAADLAGVHVLFLSEHDLPEARERSRELLSLVPVIALTRGWRGLYLITRDGEEEIPGLPRQEVDPTGAGDVFAATFLMRYQETGNLAEAAAFATCGASCVVEGIAATTLGDRPEVERRLFMRERIYEDGEWEE